MSAVTRYLAEIPWNCCIPEENWDFVSIADDSEDMRKEKRKIFLVNATFPFYIPMELHSMDVWAMRENCPDGQYWAVASLFLLYNNSHTIFAWDKIGSDNYSEMHEDLCRPSISTQMLSEIFPSSIPQCKSAVHFLLDLTVLVQLPFKPVLLHQWLVAAYQQLLRFQIEMVEFSFIPFDASQDDAVDDIFQMLKSLALNIQCGFEYLRLKIYNKNMIKDSVLEGFDTAVQKICLCVKHLLLPFEISTIDFGMREVKEQVWYPGSGSKYVPKSMKSARTQLEKRAFVDDFLWWKIPKDKRWIFGDYSQGMNSHLTEQFFANNDLEFYNPFLEPIPEKVKNDKEFISCFTLYKKHENNLITIFHTVRVEDRGILENIYFLEAKRDLKISLVRMLKRYAELIDDPNLPYMLLQEANQMIDEVMPEESRDAVRTPVKYNDFKEPFIPLRKILIELQGSVGEHEKSKKPMTYMVLQDRIRSLVYRTIAAQYKVKGSKKDDVGRDWHIGFLLPCFVSSLLELNEDPAVDEELKNWYMNFIDQLIASYEETGFEKLNNVTVSSGIEECSALFVLQNLKRPALLLSYFKTIERAFLAEMQGAPSILMHFKKYHLFDVLYESLEFSEEKADLLREPSIPWMWQLLEFFRRMEKALRSCATERSILKDPLNTEVTEEQMIELIKLMWIAGTDQSAFKSNVSSPAEILRALCTLHHSEQLSEFLNDVTDCEESEVLCTKNVLRIALDLVLRRAGRRFEFSKTMKATCSPLDMAFHSFLTKANGGQMWALREFASKYFGVDWIDSYNTAEINAPIYQLALFAMDKEDKVKFDRGSSNWFFPIRLCRWCGSLEPQDGIFLTCIECCNDDKYPDSVIYCSEYCQENASMLHQQEHKYFRQFKALKIGLSALKFNGF